MSDRLNFPERNECRLIVIDPHSMRILSSSSAADHFLPNEGIPEFARVAEALNEAIERRYGLRTVQLAILPGAEGLTSCAIHEIVDVQGSAQRSLSFMALDETAPTELTERDESLVLKIMQGEPNEFGRFARLGWIDELYAKIDSHRDQTSAPVIRQLNQGIDFCLLNLQNSNGRTLWFKAVGEPNTREYGLTQELTRQFPECLPKLVAWIPEWNGWISERVVGVPLKESKDPAVWEDALKVLASMQRQSEYHLDSLRAAGAKDLTTSRLRPLLAPFFAEAEDAMRAQTSTRVAPLSSDELHQLKLSIDLALEEISTTGLPETLLHGDIGHGNVIASTHGPVFLDWAETYIGHPFISAEHLLADLDNSLRLSSQQMTSLRLAYAASWQDYLSPSALRRVVALAPAVAAIAYVLIAWEANRLSPGRACVWPLMRAVLRRAKRELEQISKVAA